MKRTRYGTTGLSLPTNHGATSKQTRLSERVNVYTCKTTDRATFVKKKSPFGSSATWWYIFILFRRALIVEVRP